MKRPLSTLALAGLAASALQAQDLKINALLITWYHQALDSNLRTNNAAPGGYYTFGGSGDALRESGFSTRRVEIYLNSRINDEITATVIFDPKENSPILLDATATWKPNARVEVKAGQFKPLQSFEATSIGSPDLLFVDRGQFARRFGDIRDRGVTAAYTFGDKDMSLKVTAGVFNGANRANDANAQKDFVLRADFSAGAHKAGLFALQGVTDVKDTTGLAIVPSQGVIDAAWGVAGAPTRAEILDHKDKTTNLGAYYRFARGAFQADAEVVTGLLGRRFATLAATAPGLKREHLDQKFLSACVTAAYTFAERHQITFRHDLLDLNSGDDWYTAWNPYTHTAVGVARNSDYSPRFTETTFGYTFAWDPKSFRKANLKLNYILRSKNMLQPAAGQSGEQGGDSLVAALQVYF